MHATSARNAPAEIEVYGMNISTFAERLGCSKSHVWKLVADKKVKAIRLGKRRIIPSTELARLLSEAE